MANEIKITSNKQKSYREEITAHEEREIRIRISKGNIITIVAEYEDDDLQYWDGKSAKDKAAIKKLKDVHLNYIADLLSQKEDE